MKQTNTPVYLGHRERMKRKLKDHGTRHFETYELLEMLLYYVIPRRNTHPTAKLLLRRFSTLDAIFSASESELMSVEGIGPGTASFIRSVGILMNADMSSDTDCEKKFVATYDGIGKFFLEYFKGKTESEVALLMLDSKMNYIDVCKIYSVDLSSGAVHSKPFIDAAVKRGASVCMIAHNHLYSSHFPTNGDWETNKLLREAFEDAGISLVESYVVTDKYYSGFMSVIETKFTQQPELSEFILSKVKKQ